MRDSVGIDLTTRPQAVICDVDGTLCDVTSVRHYVERPPGAQRFRPDFAKFHSASADCPAFPQVLSLVTDLQVAGCVIVVVTAREARWTELTERWLGRQGVVRAEVITRGALDYRPDSVVKAEICAMVQTKYAPVLALDDRDDIIDVWNAASIPTIKVDERGSLSPISWSGGIPVIERLSNAVESAGARLASPT